MRRKLIAIILSAFVFFINFNEDANSYRILLGDKERTIYLIEQAFPKEFLNEIDIRIIDAECIAGNGIDSPCSIGDYAYLHINIAGDRRNWHTLNQTILHEMGHHIWYKYLTKEEKNLWLKNYNETQGASEYADESSIEDFADYYAGYILNFKVKQNFHKIKYRNETREMILEDVLRRYPKFDLRNITL